MAPSAPVFEYLSPFFEIVWEELGGVVLLEKVCHYGQDLGYQKSFLVIVSQDVSSHPLTQHHAFLTAAMIPVMMSMESYLLKLKP